MIKDYQVVNGKWYPGEFRAKVIMGGKLRIIIACSMMQRDIERGELLPFKGK